MTAPIARDIRFSLLLLGGIPFGCTCWLGATRRRSPAPTLSHGESA